MRITPSKCLSVTISRTPAINSHGSESDLIHEFSARLWYLLCCPKRHKHSSQLLYPKGRSFLLHH